VRNTPAAANSDMSQHKFVRSITNTFSCVTAHTTAFRKTFVRQKCLHNILRNKTAKKIKKQKLGSVFPFYKSRCFKTEDVKFLSAISKHQRLLLHLSKELTKINVMSSFGALNLRIKNLDICCCKSAAFTKKN